MQATESRAGFLRGEYFLLDLGWMEKLTIADQMYPWAGSAAGADADAAAAPQEPASRDKTGSSCGPSVRARPGMVAQQARNLEVPRQRVVRVLNHGGGARCQALQAAVLLRQQPVTL